MASSCASPDAPFPRWCRAAVARAAALLPVKAVGTMAFMLLFFAGYFAVLRHPLAAPVLMPLTPPDAWIPFSPAALPVYASLWVYVSLPPLFFRRLRPLALYGLWVGGLCLGCLAVFWLFPTVVPAFAVDHARHPELAVIKGLDAAGNACPSLHVASAVFSACWLDRFLLRLGAPGGLRGLSGLHCLAILWSTIALRQHVALDVLAGLAVGAVFAVLSYRQVRRAVGDAGL